MNYDHDILGVGNPLHPANQPEDQTPEIITYTEFLEAELCQTYFKPFLDSFKAHVAQMYQADKTISQIEENKAIFGSLTYEEELELRIAKKTLTSLIKFL